MTSAKFALASVLALSAAALAACAVESAPAPTNPTSAPSPKAPSGDEPAEEASAEEAPAEGPAEVVETFGDPLTGLPPVVAIADLAASPVKFRGQTVRLAGAVRAVCQKKGCWMEVRPEEDREAAGVTVKFKGYAFFMPKDARGAYATLEGKVNVLDLTPAEVAEFEREGGEIANKNPDGSATTLLVMANGVELRGRAQ